MDQITPEAIINPPAKKPEVYCKDCKFCLKKENLFGMELLVCEKATVWEKDYSGSSIAKVVALCAEKNENKNCLDFKPKRTWWKLWQR